MKVYAVYSIPKSPEYQLEKLFKTKEGAKEYIWDAKNNHKLYGASCPSFKTEKIYDIQLEEVEE